MKKIFLLLLIAVSFSGFAQKNDTDLKSQVTSQIKTPNTVSPARAGAMLDSLIDGKQSLYADPRTITATTYTVQNWDVGKTLHCTHASGCTMTITNTLPANMVFHVVRDAGAGTVTFVAGGTASLSTIGGELTLESEVVAVTWEKISATVFQGFGALGPATSGVTDGDKGDITVTASGATWTIDNLVVTPAKMSTFSSADMRGKYTDELGTGAALFDGATPTSLVGTNITGTAAGLTAGTVTTNADLTGDVTSTGNATTYNGTVPVNKGGTNITSYTVGDIPYASGATTLSKLADVAIGSYLASQGTGTAPAYVPFPWVTPEMYGAIGDGATDDQAAMNAALAASDYVFLSGKNYRIATTMTTDDDDHIMGSGNSTIISVASNIAVITIGGINNTIENLQILGSGSGAGQNGITAIGNGSFNQYRYFTNLEKVWANNLGNAGFYTINTIGADSGSEHQGTYNAVLCRATSCAVGFLMDTRGEYNTFTNCTADTNVTGVRFNGGNDSWTGGKIVDNTTGLYIGSGTNDGHGVTSGALINHNGSNVTSVSTVTGYSITACEIVAGSITLTTCTDIRFYGNDIASAPVTSTNAVGTVFAFNCFRTTPTITVAAGNTPGFVFNTNPAGSTVHALIVNTVQGGISSTQQGPTSPNTWASTWTTTASGQYGNIWNGTITPRATASDLTRGLIVDINHTQTANTQIYYDLDINPTATLATGGFTGTENGALRTRGKVNMRALTTTGAVTGTDGFTYQKSNGDLIFEMSPDAILRFGNAGSRWNIVSTSDGLVSNNNGNGALISLGSIGANFSANNTAAGTVNSRGIGIIGGSLISSGTTEYAALRIIPTHNQTGSATGDVLGIDYNPTLTAVLGNHYFIRNRSIAANSAFAMTAVPTAKIHIGASVADAGGASLKIVEGTRQTSPEDGTINYVANNLEFVETSTVYILAKTLTATATLNFDLTAVNSQDLTITLTGAALGDAVAIALDAGSVPADITYFGWVSATDTVSIRCSRVGGGGAVDPASGTFRASIIKY